MRRIISANREQELFLPPCVEDWIGPEHPARFIAEFVGQIDLREAGLDSLERYEGGVAHEPALLLSAWLYGYYTKRRSTRALEEGCRDSMALVWLTGNTRPDHNSLWRYWNRHREGLRSVFRQTVRVAMEMKLVGMVTQALDGTKIAAACGRKKWDEKKLAALQAALDMELEQWEEQIMQAGAQGAEKLPVGIRDKHTLREHVREALVRVREKRTSSANPHEPEATLMSQGPAYNAQAVADASHQIIVAAGVIDEVSDQSQTEPMTTQARENLKEAQGKAAPEAPGEPAEEPGSCASSPGAKSASGAGNAPLAGQAGPANIRTLADGGYASAQNFARAVRAGHELLTPPPAPWRDLSSPWHSAHFTPAEDRSRIRCPQGRELPRVRRRIKDNRHIDEYQSARVCRDCPVRARCTRSKHGRTVEVPVEGYEELVRRRQQWENPEVKQAYRKRSGIIEPVFAQIKNVMRFTRWTQ
jgi:transposase